jgi:hypothetical protein
VGPSAASSAAYSAAERQAINTVIQGSASEVIKVAMLLVQKDIANHPLWSASSDTAVAPYAPPLLLMQIHDELIFELPLYVPEGNSRGELTAEQRQYVDTFVSVLQHNMVDRVSHIFFGQSNATPVPLAINIRYSTESWGQFVDYIPIS